MIGAPLLTLPTARSPRKMLLLARMAIFTLGNAMAALSPSYGVLMARGSSPRSATAPSSA